MALWESASRNLIIRRR